ncbi:hypothetical protein GXY_03343 [Novacetimonas hansenii ATCC 23769]|uniref:Uncharacterized protein n=1 Tax=Novacetimonas hansenii ATCC 23769 TaxID=714995 RepID=D5QC22_NOVHA|nr:hypothetical protein GXY_03343 [Novacetimonas hansenii ATCC 23769]
MNILIKSGYYIFRITYDRCLTGRHACPTTRRFPMPVFFINIHYYI